MTCPNPNCRHRSKRKLRPLVISLLPRDDGSGGAPATTIRGGEARHEQIKRMFATHPSLAAHFESPVFSPGVAQRDLRNRLKLLDHCNRAGLIPPVEWEAICRAVNEQTLGYCHDGKQDEGACCMNVPEGNQTMKIDPFRYLAVETKIQPDGDGGDEAKGDQATSTSRSNGEKFGKKNERVVWQIKSLVPISPHRRGSAEDRSMPYSMEFWQKAKSLNRDRSVLACTLAHLLAMKTLVDGCEGDTDDSGGFDFILEDNVRAFVGAGYDGAYPEDAENGAASQNWAGWSCECANRIWDTIEASNEAPSKCHMRYFGWLGSSPNLAWTFQKHIPRSTFGHDAVESNCTLFPFPTNEDFELDSIDVSSKAKKQDGEVVHNTPEEEDEDQTSPNATASKAPHFTTPGGTAVWGTFAYTVSPSAYRTLINSLQNDVGALMWKGKRMRAYRAKPIDKVLPRHVYSEFGSQHVHLPAKVAFVRGPMLGSLLHPQWEEGFCNSTELQYSLSCGGKCGQSLIDGSAVWDHVWLTSTERQVVNHRRKEGKWITKDELEHAEPNIQKPCIEKKGYSFNHGNMVSLMVASILVALSSIGNCVLVPRVGVHAFSLEASRMKRRLGKVPIISRTIPLEINGVLDEQSDRSSDGTKRLDVTVWEMDKPSELIQEWWSIDATERASRVGDPFGVVMWPGSIVASKELMLQHYASPDKSPILNATVVVLGAGTGVEAQAAALLGARKVIATDINPLTLKLLEYGAKSDDRIGDVLKGKYFDLFSDEPLPACDILIAADVLYNPELAIQVGRRIHEVITRSFDEGSPPTKVIVTDSQQFHGTNFLKDVAELVELNSVFREGGWEELKWESQQLEKVCASGVLVDEDQTYDVNVRVIRWGW